MGKADELALRECSAPKLKMSKPTPMSATRRAFVPGMRVVENGVARLPSGAVDFMGSADREPSLAIAHVARNPE